jgi:translation initiation factor 5A
MIVHTNYRPQEDASFQSADAGSSITFPMLCSSLRKNGHVLVKSRPCKIVEISSSATGKHGHVKTHIVGIDIFTGKKLEDIWPSNSNVDIPAVSRTKYSLVRTFGLK